MESRRSHTTLIKDACLLQPHQHTDPVGRDEERQQIKAALEPLKRGHKPSNLALYGPPGTGKTTCIHDAFTDLEDSNVATALLNCSTYSTRSAIHTKILESLGYVAPKKGHSIDTKLNKLQQRLDTTPLAVALDELDRLEDLNDVIYDLYDVGVKASSPIGIILSCDKHPEKIDFDHRSMSRLQYRCIKFDPYTVNEMRDILRIRVENAFRNGTVADGVVDQIAEHVAQDAEHGQGDMRRAIDLLRMTGQQAQRNGKRKVTVADVEAVLDPGYA